MSSWNELGILRNLKMWSSDNHLKLYILKRETFILIPSLNEMQIQQRLSVICGKFPHSFQLTLWELATLKIWGHIISDIFLKGKNNSFWGNELWTYRENCFSKRNFNIPYDSNSSKNNNPKFLQNFRLSPFKKAWLFLGLALDSTPVSFIQAYRFNTRRAWLHGEFQPGLKFQLG